MNQHLPSLLHDLLALVEKYRSEVTPIEFCRVIFCFGFTIGLNCAPNIEAVDKLVRICRRSTIQECKDFEEEQNG